MLKQRPRIRAALLLATPILACALLAVAAQLLRPRTFASHQETIGYALEQRNIRASTIEISQNWPEAVNYYAYGHQIYPFNVNVVVRVADGREVSGRMECLDDQRRCTLYMPRLGLEGARLPDVSARAEWPWEGWLAELAGKVKSLMNA